MSEVSIPPSEQSIYDDLTEIRQHLSTLKKDRKNFIRSKDVFTTYHEVLALLNKLDSVRNGEETTPNRVDYLIDDIFQLLSLCFMTAGLTQTAPATYASLSTVQRLLEHLDESGVYTNLELQPIKERLNKFKEIISNSELSERAKEEEEAQELEDDRRADEEDQNVEVGMKDEFKILNQKLNKCFTQLQLLVDKISQIPPELQQILSQLVSIRRNLMNLITRDESSNETELQEFKAELKTLENSEEFSRVTKNLREGEGLSLLNGLIDDCHTLIQDSTVSKKATQVDPNLKELYNQLIKIKVTLENLLVTRRWTLRETDLFNYQKLLQEIDNNRKQGLFLTSSGEAPAKGQTILLYLLRRCYAIIYKLLESSEPISEALQPIHNQLSTVRRCLLDVKRMGGISSIRELYPYQLKLASIDNLRIDGKFMYEDQIPEGQGALTALLAECFDIVHELKVEYYDTQETEEEDIQKGGIETTKSSNNKSDSYDGNDDDGYDEEEVEDEEDLDAAAAADTTTATATSDKARSLDDEEELDASLLLGEDGVEDDAYDLPSYAASVNDSEVPTDVER